NTQHTIFFFLYIYISKQTNKQTEQLSAGYFVKCNWKRQVLSRFLKIATDSAVRIAIGKSFHQVGTVQEKVRDSDFVPLWDGTTRRRSLAERKLLEGV
ncbi:MAG: hypothetical protein ACRDCE_14475, partial [Cetobacterium sp.]|uniref:hypothetical protein n=1 Tax=Cetobacterium sp. TaxID=2071632 RepID=UPI003EE7FCA8